MKGEYDPVKDGIITYRLACNPSLWLRIKVAVQNFLTMPRSKLIFEPPTTEEQQTNKGEEQV